MPDADVSRRPTAIVIGAGATGLFAAHLVWSGGAEAFEELLPGFVDDTVARGARLVHIMGDMVSRAPNTVWFRRFEGTRHRNPVCSRNLLDHALRERVLRDAMRVTGLRVQAVPMSGRSSRTWSSTWLENLGLPRVTERQVDAGVIYATRIYEAPSPTSR